MPALLNTKFGTVVLDSSLKWQAEDPALAAMASVFVPSRFSEADGDPRVYLLGKLQENMGGTVVIAADDPPKVALMRAPLSKAFASELRKDFQEHEHPRGDDGKFIDKHAIENAKYPTAIAKLMRKVNNPKQRKILVDQLKKNGMSIDVFRDAQKIAQVDATKIPSVAEFQQYVTENAEKWYLDEEQIADLTYDYSRNSMEEKIETLDASEFGWGHKRKDVIRMDLTNLGDEETRKKRLFPSEDEVRDMAYEKTEWDPEETVFVRHMTRGKWIEDMMNYGIDANSAPPDINLGRLTAKENGDWSQSRITEPGLFVAPNTLGYEDGFVIQVRAKDIHLSEEAKGLGYKTGLEGLYGAKDAIISGGVIPPENIVGLVKWNHSTNEREWHPNPNNPNGGLFEVGENGKARRKGQLIDAKVDTQDVPVAEKPPEKLEIPKWTDEDEAKFQRYRAHRDGEEAKAIAIMDKFMATPRAKYTLTQEQRDHYQKSWKSAISKLSDKALDRVNKNLGRITCYSDSDVLARSIYGQDVGRLVGGAWARLPDEVNGELHLDGGYDIKDKNGKVTAYGNSTEEIYLHELSHVIDGVPKGEPMNFGTFSGSRMSSDSAIWTRPWEEEINQEGHPLSKYATTSAREGFAEFGRYLLNSSKRAREDFPKCYAAWERLGLGFEGKPWESF